MNKLETKEIPVVLLQEWIEKLQRANDFFKNGDYEINEVLEDLKALLEDKIGNDFTADESDKFLQYWEQVEKELGEYYNSTYEFIDAIFPNLTIKEIKDFLNKKVE